MKDEDVAFDRLTFVIPEKLKIELKVICILTKKTMSTFIRSAIQEKIKLIKLSKNKEI